jgi:hypothetical protein
MLGKVALALAGLRAGRMLPRWSALTTQVGIAHQVVGIAKALIVTQTHAAANRGALAVAKAVDLGAIWVPERDACNRCQSFAGSVAGPGGRFAPGPYFGDGSAPDPTRNPPLHRNCRCKIIPVVDPASETAMSDALRREARRSLAKGWTEAGGESNAAALRAAERLLQAADRSGRRFLPKSVLNGAESALSKGKFISRTVPRGSLTAEGDAYLTSSERQKYKRHRESQAARRALPREKKTS